MISMEIRTWPAVGGNMGGRMVPGEECGLNAGRAKGQTDQCGKGPYN